MTPTAGRAIAWLSFALGIAVSVAGNIMHSAITPAGPGELVGAAFWPLALMLSIEILTRVRWQSGKRWMAARVLGLILVGTVAAVLSYRHLAGLMTSWGEDPFNAHLGPLAVDGLMLLAATALLSISREAKPEEIAEPIEEKPVAVIAETVEDSAGISYKATPVRPVTVEKIESEPPKSTTYIRIEATTEPEPPKEPSRLHIVDSISDDAAVEAARQAFFQSLDETGKPLSAAKVAIMLNQPKSTVHRNYTSRWAREGRRIER